MKEFYYDNVSCVSVLANSGDALCVLVDVVEFNLCASWRSCSKCLFRRSVGVRCFCDVFLRFLVILSSCYDGPRAL
jgi:hypothetical protein